MPPSRPRAQPDDATSTASSTKEKAAPTSATAPNGKRRVAANTATGSSLRDVVTSGQANSASNTTAGNQETPGVSLQFHAHLETRLKCVDRSIGAR